MKKKKESYIILPSKMVRSESLTIHEKVLFAVLMTYNGLEQIYPTYETLSKQSGIKRTKLSATIKSLEEKKYIKVVKRANVNSNIYQILSKGVVHEANGVVHKVNPVVHEADGGGSRGERGVVHEAASNTIYKGNIDLIINIVGYLNSKLGTKYSHKSKKNQTLIMARIKEGHTLNDFKSVIDKKYTEWHNDPGMVKFLRPETLFGTKFESYLNQLDAKVTQTRSRGRRII